MFGIDAYLAYIRPKQIPPAKLTIQGPYALVRHPFYALVIVALWAMAVLPLDRLLLNVLFTGWIVLGASLEERDLLAEFGKEYSCYRQAVPMFIPRRWTPLRKADKPPRKGKRLPGRPKIADEFSSMKGQKRRSYLRGSEDRLTLVQLRGHNSRYETDQAWPRFHSPPYFI